MSTGILLDPRFNDHFMGPGHIECPERLEAIADILDAGLDFSFERIAARPASSDEIAYIHAPEYVDFSLPDPGVRPCPARRRHGDLVPVVRRRASRRRRNDRSR